MRRRQFILTSAIAMAAASAAPLNTVFAGTAAKRKFRIALNPGIIGVKANFTETLNYAIKYGYEGISPFTQEVMRVYSDAQLNGIRAKMKAHNITYDSLNIPVHYRRDAATYRDVLMHFP